MSSEAYWDEPSGASRREVRYLRIVADRARKYLDALIAGDAQRAADALRDLSTALEKPTVP